MEAIKIHAKTPHPEFKSTGEVVFFDHDTKNKEQINNSIQQLEAQIDTYHTKMQSIVKKDQLYYMKNFATQMKLLHKDYKLQTKVVEKITGGKELEHEQTRKVAERDRIRQEFEASEKQATQTITEYQGYKRNYQEIISDLDFTETQIN
jgi:chaperonin cofactor prefoldin